MKVNGIIRRVDDLGRVVIPREFRRTMGVEEGDPMEMYINEDGNLVVKRYDVGTDLLNEMKRICNSFSPDVSPKVASMLESVCNQILKEKKERDKG